GVSLRHRLTTFAQDLYLAGAQVVAFFIFLADNAWRMTDAIIRTLWRLFVSRRHLLEWTTAAQSSGRSRRGVAGFYGMMSQGVCLALAMSAAVLFLAPASWPLVVPFALLWLLAPAGAWWISRPRALPPQLRVWAATAGALRLTARRTGRYFETFVTVDDHRLPPDNFQETPSPVLARRTSPTNIGLYLLSTVAARDFGWTGMEQTIE